MTGRRFISWRPILVAYAVNAACAGDADEVPELPLAGPALEPTLVREWRPESHTDSFALHRAGGLAWRENAVYVVDSGNDRIVVLDSLLVPMQSFGRSGAGPGELELPTAATFTGDTLVIANANNQRLDLFGTAGDYIRSINAPAFTFTLTTDALGRLHAPIRDSAYYAIRWADDGATTRLAPRPASARVRRPRRTLELTAPLLALTPGDTVHVLDNGTGFLLKFSPQGAIVLQRSLPASLLRRLEERRRAIVNDLRRQGRSVRSFPLAKTMVTTGDGMLLLLVGDSLVPGLLIDPHTYFYRAIEPVRDSTGRPFRSASAATFHPPNLHVLAQDGLFSYRMPVKADAH